MPAGSLGDPQETAADSRGPARRARQAQRANALAAEQGLAERVRFQVADALQQPFADASFDLVWSMESGEHMCAAGCPADRVLTAATCWRPHAACGRGCWVTDGCHTLSRLFTPRRPCVPWSCMSAAVFQTAWRAGLTRSALSGSWRACASPAAASLSSPGATGARGGFEVPTVMRHSMSRSSKVPACAHAWNSTQLGWHASKTAHLSGCRITHRAHGSSWCSRAAPRARNLRPGEAGLTADEQALLDRICEAYYLPAWCSEDDYRRICTAQGLQACPG